MSFANVTGNLSGLPRILAALATGGVSELAVNAKQNLNEQNQQALAIDADMGRPWNQSPSEINADKANRLAELGTAPAMELYQNYRTDPVTKLSNEEKKARILNLQQEASLRGEQIKKVQNDNKISQNLMKFRQDLFPTLIEPGQEPQGPADMTGATLPKIAPTVTTDPAKLQQAAITALMYGDEKTAEGLGKMQDNKLKTQLDQSRINYNNSRATAADTTAPVPTVLDAAGLPITGDEFLKILPPHRATAARALAEGRGIYPTGTYAKSPAGQQLIADAMQYDPELDANTFKKRGAAQIAYGSGTQGKNVVALKTAVDHILHLAKAADKLTDTGFQMGNELLNKGSKQVGGTGITNYETVLNTAAPEIVKAYVPTGGTEHDRIQMRNNFDPKLTKVQKKEAIATQAELMLNRLEQLQAGYDEAMGKVAKPLVDPKIKEKLQKLQQGLNPDQEVPAETENKAPKVNPTKVFKRVNGKLVQVK